MAKLVFFVFCDFPR